MPPIWCSTASNCWPESRCETRRAGSRPCELCPVRLVALGGWSPTRSESGRPDCRRKEVDVVAGDGRAAGALRAVADAVRLRRNSGPGDPGAVDRSCRFRVRGHGRSSACSGIEGRLPCLAPFERDDLARARREARRRRLPRTCVRAQGADSSRVPRYSCRIRRYGGREARRRDLAPRWRNRPRRASAFRNPGSRSLAWRLRRPRACRAPSGAGA